jgi:hypothetical protein
MKIALRLAHRVDALAKPQRNDTRGVPRETGFRRAGRPAKKPAMLDIVLSITVLAAIALCGGAWLAWKRGHRKQALLMLVLVAVALLNVAIWTVPDEGGTAPLDRVERGAVE